MGSLDLDTHTGNHMGIACLIDDKNCVSLSHSFMCTNKLLRTIFSVAALKIEESFREFFPLMGIFKIHLFMKIQKTFTKMEGCALFKPRFCHITKIYFQK